MFRFAAVVPLLLTLLTAACAGAEGNEALEARPAQPIPAHPRLLLGEGGFGAVQAKLDADPALQAVWEFIRKEADAVLDAAPVERIKTGKRLLSVSRTCLQRVGYLALAHGLTGNEAYARRAEQEMLAASAFEDWNPSHFLDVAEMTAALGIGYDWLYDALTPGARDTIRAAILSKGLETSFPGGGWVRTDNNWNQVCHGGLVLGALAVMEDAPEIAKQTIERAIEYVPIAMKEYEPDGVYPEGPTYWAYGTTYNVLLIAALESALGSAFGLDAHAGFMASPEFYLHATGPQRTFFNFSDCGLNAKITPAMFWFAKRLNNPSLLWFERQVLEAGDVDRDRMLPFLLAWASDLDAVTAPGARNWQGDGRTPVALMRSGWDDTATFAGIKGGSPGSNHAHMDIGSFVLDRGGVRWVEDLGMQDYNSLETAGVDLWNRKQDSQRWDVFRISNLSHSTLVVDGQKQVVKGHAPIVRFSGETDAPFALVDLGPVYEGQLAAAERGLALRGDRVVVQDEITAPDHAVTVRWGLVTRAEAAVDAEHPGTATLEQKGQTLTVQVQEPADARIAILDLEHPPHDYDAPNPGVRMVTFEITLEPGAQATLAVTLDTADAAGAEWTPAPLSAW